MKSTHGDVVDRSRTANFDFSALNVQQHLMPAIVKEHLMTPNSPQLLGLVRGTAGVGKSFVIDALVKLCSTYLEPDEFELCAPTGCAASNIDGCTLHGAFCLPTKGDALELDSVRKARLELKCHRLKILIIDEDSMCGRKLFGFLHDRMSQGCRHLGVAAEVPFGGVSVIVFGDEGQLPPVKDKPKYNEEDYSKHYARCEKLGVEMYKKNQIVVLLNEVVRQNPNDPFYQLLLRVRRGDIQRKDWEMLCERNICRLPEHEQRLFRDGTVKLFSTKESAADYNEECLKLLGNPVAVCHANHSGDVGLATSLDPDLFCGLHTSLRLSVGAFVMLRTNLWVNQKLVNGTIGTVVAILYPENSSGPPNLPAGVVIHVPLYNGPGYDGKARHILVTPMEIAHMYQGRMRLTRTQLPLTLAWGITIHKSQGMTIGDGRTIPRIKVHFGNREFSLGLTFVALSRVTSLGCIAFEPMPSFDRMLTIFTSTLLQPRLQEMARIDRLATHTDACFTHLRGTSLP